MWYSAVGPIVTLILSLLAVPLAAAAQPAGKVWRIGYLGAGSGRIHEAFRQGLHDLGYVEGQHFTIEERGAADQLDRLPVLAAELVRLPVDVMVTGGGNATRAAQQATRTIPIVMAASGDPVGTGLVASLARPGGNITGLSLLSPELGAKRLELLQEVVPTASRVAVLFNPADPGNVRQWREMEGAARSLGVHLHALEVRQADEVERTLATAAREGAGALITLRNFLFDPDQARLIQWAATSQLPAMYEQREFVDAGGLMSYSPSLAASFRRAATYVDKIFKGTKPADLPVEQPMQFELVINLKTAQALGLTIPPIVLFRADEVIR